MSDSNEAFVDDWLSSPEGRDFLDEHPAEAKFLQWCLAGGALRDADPDDLRTRACGRKKGECPGGPTIRVVADACAQGPAKKPHAMVEKKLLVVCPACGWWKLQ